MVRLNFNQAILRKEALMPRALIPRTNLDALRKDAKRWRKAIEAGDPDATARYAAAARDARPAPKLREVQHALAGE
jgi:uncharacterized protein